jgi:hypothetical protein
MTRRDRSSDTDSTGDGPSDRTRGSDGERPLDDAAPDTDPPLSSSAPRRIELLAVTESDVVDALEAAARGRRGIVLRVTPPFSGRMRARLHDAGVVDGGAESGADPEETARTVDEQERNSDAAPVHIPPERFVADPPTYPTVDDTEDELRASETTYTRERHRDRHQAAVEAWRATIRERLVEEVSLDTDAASTTVSVSYLG